MNVAANRRRLIPIPGRRAQVVQVVAAASIVILALGACSSSKSGGGGGGGKTGTITVAVVDNPLMSTIKKLTPAGFTASHPGIKVKFVTLDENTLRDQVTKDVAAGGGQFDVVMIGPNDIPTWAKNGWVKDLTKDASDPAYDVNDIIKPVRDALSSDGKLYAVPFYGESSFLMYRKDLLAAANQTMPANPTWDQVAAIAQKLNNPAKGMSGICLRGKTGWGENLAALDTVVNTFGGQWFNTKWEPQLTAAPFKQAVNFYVDLIKKAAGGQDERVGLVVGVGAVDRGFVQASGCRVAVHELGDVEGLHHLRRAAERLGRGAAGHAGVHL